MKNITLVILLVALTLAACAPSRPQSAKDLGVTELVGVWRPENNQPAEKASEISEPIGYLLIKINPDYSVDLETAGLRGPNGKINLEAKRIRFGQIERMNATSAKIVYSDEMLNDARQNGSSEAEVQEAKDHPCWLQTAPNDQIDMKCDKAPPVSLVRVNLEEEKKLRDKAAQGIVFLQREKAYALKHLGTKKYELVAVQHAIEGENGRVQKHEEKPKTQKIETIQFSKDFGFARINNKEQLEVEFLPGRNLKTSILVLLARDEQKRVVPLERAELRLSQYGFKLLQTVDAPTAAGKPVHKITKVYRAIR